MKWLPSVKRSDTKRRNNEREEILLAGSKKKKRKRGERLRNEVELRLGPKSCVL